MNPDDSFISILSTMLGQSSMNVSAKRIFLFSHRGWSLFDSSVGDNDPGKVNCESLSIKSGVPTNTRTNERKFMMIDAPRIRPKGDTRWPVVMDRGNHYVPRCVSPIVKRTELYSSRAKEFWQSLRFDVDESGTPLRSREVAKFSYYASYKQLHNGSWGVVKTMPCSHPKNESGPLPLDMGVLTAKGFVWVEKKNEPEQRICIVLVKGDSRARWLVIAGLVIDDSGLDPHMYDELKRRVMLRCDSCCEDCAVKSASAMEGKWLVIL
ncbi:hypothetical protein MMC12_006428 [Toensbergia leucococca]|nr:hypothetical protein [Toensbergia leucococca]